jgi:hypothetical protein
MLNWMRYTSTDMATELIMVRQRVRPLPSPNITKKFHVKKKLTRAWSLLAACLGLFMALPAKAASLQLVPNWGASGVPANLSMYVYVPVQQTVG